jgi:hypothetical protein
VALLWFSVRIAKIVEMTELVLVSAGHIDHDGLVVRGVVKLILLMLSNWVYNLRGF